MGYIRSITCVDPGRVNSFLQCMQRIESTAAVAKAWQGQRGDRVIEELQHTWLMEGEFGAILWKSTVILSSRNRVKVWFLMVRGCAKLRGSSSIRPREPA